MSWILSVLCILSAVLEFLTCPFSLFFLLLFFSFISNGRLILKVPGDGVDGCKLVPSDSHGPGPWKDVLPSLSDPLWHPTLAFCWHYSQGNSNRIRLSVGLNRFLNITLLDWTRFDRTLLISNLEILFLVFFLSFFFFLQSSLISFVADLTTHPRSLWQQVQNNISVCFSCILAAFTCGVTGATQTHQSGREGVGSASGQWGLRPYLASWARPHQ